MDFAGIRAGSFCESSFPKQSFVFMDNTRGSGFTGVCSQKGLQPGMITLRIDYWQMHDSWAYNWEWAAKRFEAPFRQVIFAGKNQPKERFVLRAVGELSQSKNAKRLECAA
jgi:hypothetical protein